MPADLYDPIADAERLGRMQYLNVGGLSWPYLQMSYMIGSLKRQTYSDSMARLRMHILLYWRRGFYKTSGIESYTRQCTPARNAVRVPFTSSQECTFLDTLKVTAAKLRGSISENQKVVYPLIQRPRFLIAGELMNLLSTGEEFEQMMNLLNQFLEEGRGQVTLAKMTGIELEPETEAKLAARNIYFNAEEGIMEYPVEGTLWGASRSLSHAELAKLEVSGLKDRINVVHWTPTEAEFVQVWKWDPPVIPAEEFKPLLDYNEMLWQTAWDKINSPPASMMAEAKDALDEWYSIYERKHGLNALTGLRSARDGTNLRHLFTVYGMVHTIQSQSGSDASHLPAAQYKDVDYGGDTLDKVLAFLPEYVRSRSPYAHALSGK